MFGNMKMLGALTQLMQRRDELKESGARIQARAETLRVTGEAGGGAVRATVDGKMRLVRFEVAPVLAQSEEGRASLEGWTVDAVNAAQFAAQAQLQEIVRSEARALGLEELFDEFGGDLGKLLR